jgi:protein-disulfide isomerase
MRTRSTKLMLETVCLACAVIAGMLWSASAAAQRIPVPWKYRAADLQEEVRGPQSPAIGRAEAPVTIVSFSDYLCPYCRDLSKNLTQLAADYPDQIRIIDRHFAMTPESTAMAQAALCASEQDRFAEYHQLLFTTRGVSTDSLDGFAQQLGLDERKFHACTSAERYADRIEGDIREGERLGIQVTPTWFINGRRVVGSASLDRLQEELARTASSSGVHRSGSR